MIDKVRTLSGSVIWIRLHESIDNSDEEVDHNATVVAAVLHIVFQAIPMLEQCAIKHSNYDLSNGPPERQATCCKFIALRFEELPIARGDGFHRDDDPTHV